MEYSVEQIWKDFSSGVRRFIYNRISNRSNVDDLLQEVFLKIHSKIDSLKDETKMCSWVYQIARNTIIDYYRKHKNKPVDIDIIHLSDETDDEHFSQQIALEDKILSVIDDGNEESVEQEIASSLKEMVKVLPEKYSRALLLVEFEGISQIDLAKRLGISISGAKSRVQRGRQMLKDALMRCCHFEFDRYGTIIASCPKACCCCNS
jgi:RNA polymerase sigma-70 factor (ECF subfamily)